jgi:phage-related protein
VREWLKDLEEADCHCEGLDLMRVQFRWPVGMPLVRPMGQRLFEVRSTLPSQLIARVLFCHHDTAIVALHGFIKKTKTTPKADLETSQQRMKELKKRPLKAKSSPRIKS